MTIDRRLDAGTDTLTAPADVADEIAAAELREEIERLVQLVARKPGLHVREGEPACGWAFNWSENWILVDPADLRSLAPDLCRGLAVHEASHAAITVIQHFLPLPTLVRLLPLINAVEDLRIDAWSASRFPGAAPWLAAHNGVVHSTIRQSTFPESRQAQFLLGILERGYLGTTATETLPEVVAALDACRDSIAAAVACQPPPGDDPAGIRASQRSMWAILRDRILPSWTALQRQDRKAGLLPTAARELEAFSVDIAGHRQAVPPPAAGGMTQVLPRRGLRSHAPRGPAPGPACGTGRRGRRTVVPDDSQRFLDRYEAAWRRVAAVADRLGDELLRVLVPKRRMQWSDGHASGPRLLARRAMQFEADPRDYLSLWSRPILPHRRDPTVLLLVDRSGSMSRDSMIDRAVEATVLLTEVCHRIGVPTAVWSFADSTTVELDWDTPLAHHTRRRIGTLPSRCDGNTNMADALSDAGLAFARRRGDPKLLFVIGDGAPDDHEATLAASRTLEADGLLTVGLGLGPGTASLARYFQRSAVEITPESLVDHLAGLLGTSLLTSA